MIVMIQTKSEVDPREVMLLLPLETCVPQISYLILDNQALPQVLITIDEITFSMVC